MKKILTIMLLGLVFLVGCSKEEPIKQEETNTVEVEEQVEVIQEQPTQKFKDVLNEPKEEPITVEEEKPTDKGYYEQLLIDTNEKEEQDRKMYEEDMELANILMSVCTSKLNNSTFRMETISTHTDLEGTQLDVIKEAKEKGHVLTDNRVEFYTHGEFDDRNAFFFALGAADYFSDNDKYGDEYILDYISLNSTSDWNDTVDVFLFESNSKNGDKSGYYKDSMTSGEAAKFLPKDIQSCLSSLLKLEIKSLEKDEELGLYKIKGTTKERIRLVEESGPFAIFDRKTWQMEDKDEEDIITRSDKGYYDLSIYDIKKVDVTCYLDIETETLIALKANYKTEDENTEVYLVVTDIGTTNAKKNNDNFMELVESLKLGQVSIRDNKIFEE